MNGPINYQVIEQDGKPAFAVVPYDEFIELIGGDEATIPHDVVKLMVENDCGPVKAWRLYRKLTQGDVADAMGISQSAYNQIENSEGKYQKRTLEKLAAALNCSQDQLVE